MRRQSMPDACVPPPVSFRIALRYTMNGMTNPRVPGVVRQNASVLPERREMSEHTESIENTEDIESVETAVSAHAAESAATADTDILTFHTGGEDPDWVHDWATAERMLAQGRRFHTTQIELMDTHYVRHAYDRFLLVDGPNEFLFVSDGRDWKTDFTNHPYKKIHRLAHAWRSGRLDGTNESVVTPWARSMRVRQEASDPGATREWKKLDRKRWLELRVGPAGNALHSWIASEVIIGQGLSFATTQMGVLHDPRVKGLYDEIRIVEEDGDVIRLERGEDGRWVSDVTERIIRPENDILHLWANGEFCR